MLFFIYSRKSVDTGRGESLENQVSMCRDYILRKFPDISDIDIRIYEDLGFSGKNTARPKFQRMLRDIKALRPDYVVCYRLDRISRSVSDFSRLIEELNSLGVSFLCIREEFDTSRPMGKAMMYIASVFAQLERETIAERVRDNMVLLARDGRWLGGSTPTGYRSGQETQIYLDGHTRACHMLIEEAGELDTVRLMYREFLDKRSLTGVSRSLTGAGILSRRGKPYSLPGIKDILRNPVYCTADLDAYNYFTSKGADVCFDEKRCSDYVGLIAYNKRNYRRKNAPRQAVDKWIVAIGRHRGIISGRDWVRVQEILEENVPTGAAPACTHNVYSLLSGIIYCGICGGRLFAKPRSNGHSFDYICGSKLRGGVKACPCQNLNGPGTDTAVFQALSGFAAEDTKLFVDGLRSLRIQISSEFRPFYTSAVPRTPSACGDAAASMLACLNNLLPSLSIYEKRALIRSVVYKIVWDGADLTISLSQDGDGRP